MNHHRNDSALAELNARRREIVLNVARAYRTCKELPPIVAINHDATHRSNRWTPDSCHFVIDVEHGLAYAIAEKVDEEALRGAWERLQGEDSVTDKTTERLIKFVGPVFDRRGLHPAAYFRQDRYIHRRAAR
jgi:hypothetical protein